LDIEVRIGDIGKTRADTILLGIFDNVKKISGDLGGTDKSLNGEITKLIKQGEIKGKLSEVTIIHSLGNNPAGRVAIIGLGKSEELTPDKIRIAIAMPAAHCEKKALNKLT
jgi:leucyl aminopeptidase